MPENNPREFSHLSPSEQRTSAVAELDAQLERERKNIDMLFAWNTERHTLEELIRSKGLKYSEARSKKGGVEGFAKFMWHHTARVNFIRDIQSQHRLMTQEETEKLAAMVATCDMEFAVATGDASKRESLTETFSALATEFNALSEKVAALKSESKNPVALYLNLEKTDTKDRTHASIVAESRDIISRAEQNPTSILPADVAKLTENIKALRTRVERSVGKSALEERYTPEAKKLNVITAEQVEATTLKKEGVASPEVGITELKIAYRKAEDDYKGALTTAYEGNALAMDIRRGGRALGKAFGFSPYLGEDVNLKKARFDEAKKEYLVYFQDKLKDRYVAPNPNTPGEVSKQVGRYQGMMGQRYVVDDLQEIIDIEHGALPDSKKSLLQKIGTKLNTIPKKYKVAFAATALGLSALATGGTSLVALVAGLAAKEGIKYGMSGSLQNAQNAVAGAELAATVGFTAENVTDISKNLAETVAHQENIEARTKVLSRVGGIAAGAVAGGMAKHYGLFNGTIDTSAAHSATVIPHAPHTVRTIPVISADAAVHVDGGGLVAPTSPSTPPVEMVPLDKAPLNIEVFTVPDASDVVATPDVSNTFVYEIPSTGSDGAHAWDAVEAYLKQSHPDVDYRSQEEIVKYFFDRFLPHHTDVAEHMGFAGPNYIVQGGQHVTFGPESTSWLDEAVKHVHAGNGKIEVAPDGTFIDTPVPIAPHTVAPTTAPEVVRVPVQSVPTQPSESDFVREITPAPSAPMPQVVVPPVAPVAPHIEVVSPLVKPVAIDPTIPQNIPDSIPNVIRVMPLPSEVRPSAPAVGDALIGGAIAALAPEKKKRVMDEVRKNITAIEYAIEGRNGLRYKRFKMFGAPSTFDQLFDMPQASFEKLSLVTDVGLADMKIDPVYFRKWDNYFNVFLRNNGYKPDQRLTVGQNLEAAVGENILKTVT